MRVDINQLTVFVTSQCTLNCRLCQSCIPRFHESGLQIVSDPNELESQLKQMFQHIIRRIGSLQISGGEPLTWKPLAEMIIRLSTFSAQFDTLRIIPNGTLLPSEKLLDTVVNAPYPIEFYIDNYGPLSVKLQPLIKALERRGIPYIVTNYTGENQHGGGWIDFGDLCRKEGDANDVARRHANCRFQSGCLGLYDGSLYACSVSAMLYLFRKIQCDRIPIFENVNASQTLSDWTSGNTPFGACAYCNGFNINESRRFPAAEQQERIRKQKS